MGDPKGFEKQSLLDSTELGFEVDSKLYEAVKDAYAWQEERHIENEARAGVFGRQATIANKLTKEIYSSPEVLMDLRQVTAAVIKMRNNKQEDFTLAA
ncbi:MAG TPA: hypothetical protein PKD19_00620 [Candidatus Saccharibacteria bacterium]|nr:hypothetical protein [Candidatus Saccharibacteria bacterium]HMR38281.1 hypothetical protein [Candidatus Saccharibacteria bacterium]